MKWLLAFAGLIAGFGLGMWRTSGPTPVPISPDGNNPAPGLAPTEQTVVGKPDPVGEILLALRKKPGLKVYAALAGPLSRLTGQQIGELIDRLERESEDWGDYRPGWLANWWLERDPQEALKWISPRLLRLAENPPLQTMPNDSSEMIRAWSRAFPEEAVAMARRFPRSDVAGAVLYHMMPRKKDAPPAEGWALLRDFPESEGRAREAAKFMKDWAAKDPAAAFAAAQALAPGKTRDGALAEALPSLAAKDAAFAFEQYNRLGLADADLVAKMVEGAASRDPAGTAEWLTQLDPKQIQKSSPGLVAKWAAKDPGAAFAWMLAHPVEAEFDDPMQMAFRHSGFGRTTSSGRSSGRSGQQSAFAVAMNNKPGESIAWVRSLPEGEERERMTQSLLFYGKADDAMQLFGELSPDGQIKATHSIAEKLAKDPKRASAWAGGLPPGQTRETAWQALGTKSADDSAAPPSGADRDAWLAGSMYREKLFRSAPEESLDILLKIENSKKRREVFDRAMESYAAATYMEAQQKEALKWMEKAKLPEEWKAKWRK